MFPISLCSNLKLLPDDEYEQERVQSTLCVCLGIPTEEEEMSVPRYLPGGLLMSRDVRNKMGSRSCELSCFATI